MGPGAFGVRRWKSILRIGLCLLTLMCLGSTLYLYKHLQEKVRSSVNLLLEFKPLQERLFAQVEGTDEERSRVEQSLQKERAEHKKTKDDFVVLKSECQEALSKEKEEAMNHFVALLSHHKILKNQHEGVKRQLLDLQEQANSLKLENRRALGSHNQKYAQLQLEYEEHLGMMLATISKLMEESMVLGNAHEELRSQLLSAQEHLNPVRRMKEALQRIPSFKLVTGLKNKEFQSQAPDKLTRM